MDPLQFRAIQAVAMFHAKAEAVYGRAFPMPSVTFDLEGRVAGWAIASRNEIRLNIHMLRTNTEEFIEWTVPHELAHLITFHLYGRIRKGRGRKARTIHHGKEWKSVMRKLGVTPTRCHSMPVIMARGRSFRYVCSCRKYTIGEIKHNRCIKFKRNLICRHCKTKLVFLNEITEASPA